MSYDVAIVGLGAMGSAAAWHLARRGARVIGIDRFTPPHPHGSSHGYTRIIREAYFESPLYVPLVQRASVLWESLAAATGTPLMLRTGGLTMGVAGSPLLTGVAESARRHGLRAETWTTDEIRARVPALAPPDGMIGLWEPRAGLLYPEVCIRTMLDQAKRHGAELVYETVVTGWTVPPRQGSGGDAHGGVRVATAARDYEARRLILAAGPWAASLLPALPVSLSVERAVQYWLHPERSALCTPDSLPVFMIDAGSNVLLYGLPDLGQGVKVAVHHGGTTTTAETVRRTVGDNERRDMLAMARQWVPAAAGAIRDASVCLYTNTADGHFLIDRHPDAPQVIIASPCSGHGFKFAAAIGEVLADLATDTAPAFDLAPFGLARLRAV